MSDVTLEQLAALVAEMRDYQRRFFKDRSRDLIIKAKRLEKQVDEVCERVLEQQPKLF